MNIFEQIEQHEYEYFQNNINVTWRVMTKTELPSSERDHKVERRLKEKPEDFDALFEQHRIV